MDDNPFVDSSDVNPFEDASVANTSKNNKTAILEIDDRTDNPFHESGSTNPDNLTGNIGAATAAVTSDLRARQAELDRKEAELRRREAQLNGSSIPREKNWPPLPNWSPLKPCIYHDIDMEIPQDFQGTVRKMYHVWIFYVSVLAINFMVFLIITFIPNASSEPVTSSTIAPTLAPSVAPPNTTNTTLTQLSEAVNNAMVNSRKRRAATTDVPTTCKTTNDLYMAWFSFIWFCVFSPLSIIWYRAIYKAFRDDSSFQFFLFFFVYFFQLIFHIIQALGANEMGFGGWIQVFNFMGCSIFQGVLMLIPALGFTACAVVCIMQMIKIHDIYRSSGKTLAEAQNEWASGVMSNPHVANAARQAASEVVRHQVGAH